MKTKKVTKYLVFLISFDKPRSMYNTYRIYLSRFYLSVRTLVNPTFVYPAMRYAYVFITGSLLTVQKALSESFRKTKSSFVRDGYYRWFLINCWEEDVIVLWTCYRYGLGILQKFNSILLFYMMESWRSIIERRCWLE